MPVLFTLSASLTHNCPFAQDTNIKQPRNNNTSSSHIKISLPATVDPAALVLAEGVLPPTIELGIFGGSITFTVVVADNRSPQRFENQLHTFLALAWVLLPDYARLGCLDIMGQRTFGYDLTY